MKYIWGLLLLPWLASASAVDDLRYAMAHNADPQYRQQLTQLVAPALVEARAGKQPLVLGEVLYIKANIESRVKRQYQQSLQTLKEAASAVSGLHSVQALPVQMGIWIEQGSLNQYLGRFEQAEQYFQLALNQAEQRQVAKAQARALFRLGQLAYRRDEMVSALNYLDEASLRLLRQPDDQLQLKILATKGRIFRVNHAYDKALRFLQQALTLAEKIPAERQIPDLMVGISVVYEQSGKHDLALVASFHALDWYRKQHRLLSQAKVLLNIAGLYQGMPNKQALALQNLNRAIAIYRKNKVSFYLGTALSMRAELASTPQLGIADLNEALSLFAKRDDISSWRERQKAHERLADLYQQLGDSPAEAAQLRQAMALREKLDNDDLKDGRQAIKRLTEQVNQADRLRHSERQRLLLEQNLTLWHWVAVALGVLLLAVLVLSLWLWSRRQALRQTLAEKSQRLTRHSLSGLVNSHGLADVLGPQLEKVQQAHNLAWERGGSEPAPLLLLSLNPLFIRLLPRQSGTHESGQLLREYCRRIEQRCGHCLQLAQLQDQHLLLVLEWTSPQLQTLFEQLAELTRRFTHDLGLSEDRIAVAFNWFPTLRQRHTMLPVSVLQEVLRFSLAQANRQLDETGQSSWVSLQALELAPANLLDSGNLYQQLQDAIDKGLILQKNGH